MTKTDKEEIFNLLKTADAYANGYVRPQFAQMPSFEDDKIEKEAETQAPAPVPAQVQTQAETPTQAETQASHGITLEELNAKILRCTRCDLARTRNNVVPGQGVENPDVLVIGEGPGYDEDMQGLPFVGKAGMLLDKMLAAIQLDRNKNCYIANVVKCRPPQNRDPMPEEQAACFSFLEAQIHILKPKMILCMGRISGHKLLNTEQSLRNLRGQIHDYNGIPLMVTYHPSALLRNEELKRPAWEDLKLFRKELDKINQK
ncbi:MAG: uracil-DNA glycosylase [Treponema sp.]|nr:uracil-DNA glycosylase [Treponema sp.]